MSDFKFFSHDKIEESDVSSDEGFFRKTASGTYTAHKSNLVATTAPAVGNDDSQGYSIGSIWIDVTGDFAYICVDASTGAAVWRQMIAPALATLLANIGATKIFFATYTAVSGDDSAGYADIDTGFGVAANVFFVQILRSGVLVLSDQIITAESGGAIRIADGGATYVVTAGDVYMVAAVML